MTCSELRTRSRLTHVREHIRDVIDICMRVEKSCVLAGETQRSIDASRHVIAKIARVLHLRNFVSMRRSRKLSRLRVNAIFFVKMRSRVAPHA